MNRVKILLFAANLADTNLVRLDEEIRKITQIIRASEHRDALDLVPSLAARPDDLLQALNEHKPQIVHFSGHGSSSGEIILVDNNQMPKPVNTGAIKELFKVLKGNIRVILLNACYSRIQAEAIRDNIDCVVGMNAAIGDQAAITFAASFYRAIGFGKSIKEAFEQGKVALLLEGIPEETKPELLCKPGVDPAEIFLITEDPITLAIKSKAEGKISENAYNGFKSLIEKKFGDKSQIVKAFNEFEDNPESEEHQKRLLEQVAATKAGEDTEILEAAKALLEKVNLQPKPEAAGSLDVPKLEVPRIIPPKKGLYTNGIQFTDKDPDDSSNPPKLYLSVYFKETKHFVDYPLSTNEKWLYLEANMRPALNVRIQVRAWNMRDVDELMEFLRNGRDGWDMHGPRPTDDQAGDYFYVWRENGENRLMISTFTPTKAGVSIHARFSSEVAKAFADYLEEVGFTEPFKE